MLKNRLLVKGICIFAALILTVTALGAGVFAAGKDKDEGEEAAVTTAAQETTGGTAAVKKDETVYVLTGADGSVEKIIVSDWIRNTAGAKKITDVSDLKDIRNVKGDESYVMDSDNMKIWDANGNDLYYQGTSEKALPVGLKLTYSLDGETIKPEKLAGKSGKVTIRIDYINHQKTTVQIDGKEEELSVPFIMLSGLLLDGDHFKNVEVSNGRVLNDGDRIAVLGFALPGLQENLQLDAETFAIPDFVEITADVKDFELSTVMTLATNGIFNKIDTSKFDKLDDIKGQIGELSSGMQQLLDGSSALYGGLSQLLQKSDDLIAGIHKLYDGAGQLKAGTEALSDGLGQLVSHNAELNGGAKQVYDTLLSTVQAELTKNGIPTQNLTIENYKTVLNGLLTAPSDAQKAALIAVADTELTTQLTAAQVPETTMPAVKVMLADAILSGASKETAMANVTGVLQNAATVQAIAANTAIAPDTTVYTTLTGSGVDSTTAGLLAKLCTYLAGANQNMPIQNLTTAQSMAADAAAVQSAAADPNAQVKINQLCLGLALETIKPTVQSALTQLDSFGTFYNGILEYTAGAKKAYDGSVTLKNGAGTLAAGIGELKNGSGKLTDGVQQLTDGSKKLAEGLKEFDEKGIEKIVNLVGDKLPGILTRLKATIEISKSYNNFSGIADGCDGEVKFIFKTAEIK